MTAKFTESEVEEVALALFDGLDYDVLHGPDIAPGEPAAELVNGSPQRFEDAGRRKIQGEGT